MTNNYGRIYIYALSDPLNNKTFYVGRTKDVDRRLKQHIYEATCFKGIDEEIDLKKLTKKEKRKALKHLSNVSKMRWINNILEREDKPKMTILDTWECENEKDANRLEDAWIAIHIAKEEPLTNYLYSRRQYPNWYSPKSKHWREGYAKSPEEYIKKLKADEVKKSSGRKYRRRYRRRK